MESNSPSLHQNQGDSELGFDPCGSGRPWDHIAGLANWSERLRVHYGPGPGVPGQMSYVGVAAESNDCWFYLSEGLRFAEVVSSYRALISATVEWGDGTSTTMAIPLNGCHPLTPQNSGGTSDEYAHRYASPGTYTMRVTITSGNCATWTTGTLPTGIKTDVVTSTRTVPDRLYP